MRNVLLATVVLAAAQPLAAQTPVIGKGAPCTTENLVGTWERVSLLRNSLSVQPPDAPLFVKFAADGHWSMMEMPDGRPKLDKPLAKYTQQELLTRFDKVEGGYGTWTLRPGDVLRRTHVVNIAPGGEGNNQDRLCWFEGEILALVGTGANRSPQARFKRLPAQPTKPHNLAGTWERTSYSVNGKAMQPPLPPLVLILGEDGWFSQTQLPTGRGRIGKPLEQYSVEDYRSAFTNVGAARGTFTVEGDVFTRKHVADIEPRNEGQELPATFTLQGDTLTLRATARTGDKIEATFRRSKPLETSAQ